MGVSETLEDSRDYATLCVCLEMVKYRMRVLYLNDEATVWGDHAGETGVEEDSVWPVAARFCILYFFDIRH